MFEMDPLGSHRGVADEIVPFAPSPGFAAAHELHEQRLAEAREAAEQVTAWQARLVEATAALMDTPCADPWRPYLAWALGMTSSEAADLVELVDRLSELPATRKAMASGERSLRSILAIARRATPADEARILTDTAPLTGNQLERTLREYAKVVAPADRRNDLPVEVDDHIDPAPSSARWGWRNGRLQVRADLDAADGAAVEAVLDCERRRVADECVAGELSLVSEYDRTCAEALVSLAERAGSAHTDDVGFAPETHTTQVVVHVHEADDGNLEVDRSFVPGVGPVPTWTLAMLAERGPVVTALMLHGEPIMATEPVRLATRAQRRALLARDGGCAYPGCGIARHLIAHHIRFHDQDGPTELRNLVLLCRRHHRVVHRHGITIRPDAGAPPSRFRWRFVDDAGVPIAPAWPGAPPRHAPTTRRRTGDGDPLTAWGLDVILDTWLRAKAA